jgi:hypothetical protein
MNRRGFLFGVGSLLAAPAIVKAGSLMPVSVIRMDVVDIPNLPYWSIIDDTLPDTDRCVIRFEVPRELRGFALDGGVNVRADRLVVDAKEGTITYKLTERERLLAGHSRPLYLTPVPGWHGGHVQSRADQVRTFPRSQDCHLVPEYYEKRIEEFSRRFPEASLLPG